MRTVRVEPAQAHAADRGHADIPRATFTRASGPGVPFLVQVECFGRRFTYRRCRQLDHAEAEVAHLTAQGFVAAVVGSA